MLLDSPPLGLEIMFNIFFMSAKLPTFAIQKIPLSIWIPVSKKIPDRTESGHKINNAMPKHPEKVECLTAAAAIRDTLYVVGGKWKLPILIALFEGPLRFKELQKALDGITPKILSKELKELELNEFVTRTVYATSPVTVEYALTGYSFSLDKVLLELRDWGLQHRKRIKETIKARRAQEKN
jgi:DNA-binding HxlR family transcriptional regulator